MKAGNKRIIKNTLFLYFRLILITGVSLYTSRIILHLLGITDYGIYTLVNGIVAMFGFLNSSMSVATQRFLAIDKNRLKTFNISLVIHTGIAVLVFLVAETTGQWLISTQLNLPPERIGAARFACHFVVLTSMLSIIQVPFNALIIVHERMRVFAGISILEATLKAAAAGLLYMTPYDKLKTLSVLIFGSALLITTIYKLYCIRHFKESRFKVFSYDSLYRTLISYSGWNLFGNLAFVSRNQGINILLNIFFGTAINAAYGIMQQVQYAVGRFIGNFQVAINPAIYKSYAAGDYTTMQDLLFRSSRFSYFLAYLMVCPVIYSIDFILNLWLTDVPPHTRSFIVLNLITLVINCVSQPLVTGIQATGKIKWYKITLGILVFVNFPASYWGLKYSDCPPELVFFISMGITVVLMVTRLIFIKKLMPFNVNAFLVSTLLRILLVTLTGLAVMGLLTRKTDDLNGFIVTSMLIIILNIMVIGLLGLTRSERSSLLALIRDVFRRS